MDIVIDGYPFKSYSYEDGRYLYSYRRLREKLIELYGSCYWCGVVVREYPTSVKTLLGALPPDQATIDHVISRYHRKKGEVVPKVLACHQCNFKREKAESKRLRKMV